MRKLEEFSYFMTHQDWGHTARFYLIAFADNVSKERQYKCFLFDIQRKLFLEMRIGLLRNKAIRRLASVCVS